MELPSSLSLDPRITRRQYQLPGILRQSHDAIDHHEESSDATDFKITRKGQNEKRQYEIFMEYQGCDGRTLHLLEYYHESWVTRPMDFWVGSSLFINDMSLDPTSRVFQAYVRVEREGNTTKSRMTKRLLCVLLVELRNSSSRKEAFDSDSACPVFHNTRYHTLHEEPKVTAKLLNKMINNGGYYNNLTKHVGGGAALVLGTSLPESYWTKVITKRGRMFDTLLKKLQSTNLPYYAERFAPLQQYIINATMQELNRQEPGAYTGQSDIDYAAQMNMFSY